MVLFCGIIRLKRVLQFVERRLLGCKYVANFVELWILGLVSITLDISTERRMDGKRCKKQGIKIPFSTTMMEREPRVCTKIP